MNFEITELERERLGKLKAQLLHRIAEMRLAQLAVQAAQNGLLSESDRLINDRGWNATYDANFGEFGRFVEINGTSKNALETQAETNDSVLISCGSR